MEKFVCAAVLAAAIRFSVPVSAAEPVELRGEIYLTGRVPGALSVELYDGVRHRPFGAAPLDRDGSFRFAHVEPGSYQIQVLSEGQVLKVENVDVRYAGTHVVIHITAPHAPSSAAGIVSLKMLGHKVPKEAENLFRQGTIESLEAAVAIDPEYMQAQNNLGCRYLRLGNYGKALEHLQRAIELDPGSAMVHKNRAVALVGLRNYGDAEASIRKAMALGDTSLNAEYVLGSILAAQTSRREEGLRHLRAAAADDYQPAKAALARFQ